MSPLAEVKPLTRLPLLLCLSAVFGCSTGNENEPALTESAGPPPSEFTVYFGDLHNHSALTYGHGSFENALENAAQSLDFFTVTPHAMWPDIDELQGNPNWSGSSTTTATHFAGCETLNTGATTSRN